MGIFLRFYCRESVESLIHKHSYARSPIRTYAGDEDNLGEDGHSVHTRGKDLSHADDVIITLGLSSMGGEEINIYQNNYNNIQRDCFQYILYTVCINMTYYSEIIL